MSYVAGPAPKPNSIDEFILQTEQSAIGLLLRSPAKIAQLLDQVREEDFAEPIHQDIIAAMRWLVSEGKAVTPFSVPQAIGATREVAEGWTVTRYVQDVLTTNMLTTAGVPLGHLCETLREAATRRGVRDIASQLASAAIEGSADLHQATQEAAQLIDEVVTASRSHHRQDLDAGSITDLVLTHLETEDDAWTTTGLIDLDRYLGGWPRAQLSVLAGRPGMGKSAAATSCLLKAAQAGARCQFFSLEMTGQQLGARLLTDLAFVAERPIYYDDIQHRRLDDRQKARLRDAKVRLDGLPVQIIEQRGLSLMDIAAKARRHAAVLDRKGERLDVIFVDHMGLVRPSERYAGNRVREVAEISDGLATLAKELDVAVVALCQLNRSVEKAENKRPSLSDLRDSGAIEEDASTVTFLYRPAYYLENTREDDFGKESERIEKLEAQRNYLEFVVAKNRNGRVGVVKAWCDIGANAIRNLSYGG